MNMDAVLCDIEEKFDESGVYDAIREDLYKVVPLILKTCDGEDKEELQYALKLYRKHEEDDKLFYQLLYAAQKAIQKYDHTLGKNYTKVSTIPLVKKNTLYL